MANDGKTPQFCSYCPHPFHAPTKCTLCKCKGKPSFWQKVLSNLGDALGNAAERR